MTSTETQTPDLRERLIEYARYEIDKGLTGGTDEDVEVAGRIVERFLQTPGLIWGPGEITRNLGVSRATMKRWRDAGKFPEPYQELSIGPVWLAEDVKRWDEGRKGSGK
jgi:predicted DNA-binding transcriptional regulator AlpA